MLWIDFAGSFLSSEEQRYTPLAHPMESTDSCRAGETVNWVGDPAQEGCHRAFVVDRDNSRLAFVEPIRSATGSLLGEKIVVANLDGTSRVTFAVDGVVAVTSLAVHSDFLLVNRRALPAIMIDLGTGEQRTLIEVGQASFVIVPLTTATDVVVP